MPWVDIFWKEALEGNELNPPSKLEPEAPTSPISAIKGDEERVSGFGSGSGTDWSPVVRSMGAFIGIAFAIVSVNRISVIIVYAIANMTPAETALAVHTPSITYFSFSEPAPMVSR